MLQYMYCVIPNPVKGKEVAYGYEKTCAMELVAGSYGNFQRILSLPDDADQDNVSARFKNGILQVKIPRKSLPAPEVRQIEIRSE